MENLNSAIQNISKLITRENITLLLSIFGSVGTIFSLVSAFMSKRKNLKINVAAAAYSQTFHLLKITFSFENRSQLPITIINLKFFSGEHELKIEEYPRCVKEYAHRHGSEVVDWIFLYNLNFPVDIHQLGAVSGDVLLDISPKDFESLSTQLTVEVHSTRGQVQKIQLDRNSIDNV